MKITDADISVVVQGPIVRENELTANCLKSVRKYLPSAEIILSTWSGSDVDGLLYDVLVVSEDPGGIVREDGFLNNVNRQLVTTMRGLGKVTRTYAVKMRTDCILEGCGFVAYLQACEPCKSGGYRKFRQKIVTTTMFVRNPLKCSRVYLFPRNQLKCGRTYLFHMSDTFLFGTREDMIDLFDITPPSTAAEQRSYFPEQYIWTAFLRKKGFEVMLHPREMNFRKFKLSEFSLVDNFTLIEPEAANVRLPKRFYDNARFNNYSQMEWDKLNDRYCLSPLYQIYRMILPIVRWLEAIRQSRLIKFRWLRNRIRDRFRERCL